ncbi:MAG TPA: peptidoglycan-binding domain-containing protein [Chthoniobacterales bacterium]
MKRNTLSALFVVVLLAWSAGALRAQEDLRSVQEELRRRDLYFGDVNGRDSSELQEATRRYQQRKGFAATGRPDRETLKSLGLVPRSPDEPAPQELAWPNEPVLPSDEKIDPVAVASALNEETGVPPAAVVSKKMAAEATSPSARRAAADAAGSAAAPPVDRQQKPKNSPVITPPELARFASDYFAATSSNDVKRQLKFYADNVKYYRNGTIDRRIVEQSLRRYHARWPSRRYTMGSSVSYSRINPKGEIMLTFPVSFTLRNGQRTVRGQTSNQLWISSATVDPRITAISEQRIRR